VENGHGIGYIWAGVLRMEILAVIRSLGIQNPKQLLCEKVLVLVLVLLRANTRSLHAFVSEIIDPQDYRDILRAIPPKPHQQALHFPLQESVQRQRESIKFLKAYAELLHQACDSQAKLSKHSAYQKHQRQTPLKLYANSL
jgi:hypothetical protein